MALKKLKIFVSVSSDISTDNRVLKSCASMHDMGFDVCLIGRKKSNSISLPVKPFQIRRMKMIFQKGVLFYVMLNVRLFFMLLFKRMNGLYANDLDTLLPMYIISRIKKVPLIYDSHEIFTEVPELIHRPFKQKIWLLVERKIFKNLETIITVNESIANYYHTIYKKKIHVIRNISSKKQSEEKSIKIKEANSSKKTFRLIIQGSGLNIERGIEEAVLAVINFEDVELTLVGDGDALPNVKKLINEYGLNDKVNIIGRLPYEKMMQYTKWAHVGLSLDKPTSLNYEFSLPNKIFDYIHAGTPFIASKLVEIERIVNEFKCGVIINDINPISIEKAINILKEDASYFETLCKNCEKASNYLNWETESQKLKAIISSAYSSCPKD